MFGGGNAGGQITTSVSAGPVVGEVVDEYGTIRARDEPPRTAGPELSAFVEKMAASQAPPQNVTEDGYKVSSGPLSAGATLVRKFGSLLGGVGMSGGMSEGGAGTGVRVGLNGDGGAGGGGLSGLGGLRVF